MHTQNICYRKRYLYIFSGKIENNDVVAGIIFVSKENSNQIIYIHQMIKIPVQ